MCGGGDTNVVAKASGAPQRVGHGEHHYATMRQCSMSRFGGDSGCGLPTRSGWPNALRHVVDDPIKLPVHIFFHP